MLHVTTRDVCGGGELGQFTLHQELWMTNATNCSKMRTFVHYLLRML